MSTAIFQDFLGESDVPNGARVPPHIAIYILACMSYFRCPSSLGSCEVYGHLGWRLMMLRNVTKSDRDVMLDTFENNCRQNAAHRAANSCLIDVSSRRPRRFLFFECGFMMRSAHPVLFCSFMFIPYIYIYIYIVFHS